MPAERGPSGTGHDEVYDCREGDCECDRQGLAPDADCPYDGFPADPPVAVPGPASVSPAEPPASLNEAVADEAWISAVARKATEHLAADPVVSPADTRTEEMLRFIDAVSPFVSYVLDEPFPWKEAGQVIVWMTRDEHAEALAALEELRD